MPRSEKTKKEYHRRKNQFKTLIAENQSYPLATITYHGPSPDMATKIIVGIIKSQDTSPIIRYWSGDDIAEDVESAREISLFIKEHDVARVLTSEWVLSCPHEEGVDFPEGNSCPYCPDWH
jgi:hypothetical protein